MSRVYTDVCIAMEELCRFEAGKGNVENGSVSSGLTKSLARAG
jgi:hypothetical protein